MITIAYNVTESSSDQETGETAVNSSPRLIRFDSVVSVAHEGAATVTERAVEGGVTADHKRAEQARVTVEAWVTNTPLDAPPEGGVDAVISADVTSLADTGANVLQFSQAFDRVRGVAAELDLLRRDPITITLTTPTRDYEAVQLVSVSTPVGLESGPDALLFTMEFLEVTVAETRTGEAPVPREPRGQSRQDQGGQQGADSDEGEAAEENNESILLGMVEEYGTSF